MTLEEAKKRKLKNGIMSTMGKGSFMAFCGGCQTFSDTISLSPSGFPFCDKCRKTGKDKDLMQ